MQRQKSIESRIVETPLLEKCGHLDQRLTMEECSSNITEHCERSYSLYIPTSLCTSDNVAYDGIKTNNNIVPLVFAVHCLGCNVRIMRFWEGIAEQYKFILVIPEGIGNSWNAKYCCGYALEHNVNDIAFFDTMITQIQNNYPKHISKKLVYGMGWSNGGYMVTYAANMFRAIAPISGYQYELPELSHPVGLFMHHSENDRFVRITGCCSDLSMPQCCCGISSSYGTDQCVSALHIFQQFANQINQCSTSPINNNANDIGLGEFVEENEFNDGDIVCNSYTPNGGCQANTTFCIHANSGHFNRPSFESAFPMHSEIATFFARDACEFSGGTWSYSTKSCLCSSNGGTGFYCLVSSSLSSEKSSSTASSIITATTINETLATTANQNELKNNANNNTIMNYGVESGTNKGGVGHTSIILTLITVSFLIFAVIKQFKKTRKKHSTGYKKVSAIELRPV